MSKMIPIGDEAALGIARTMLTRSGELHYFGEFGGEVANFIPFVHWLHRQGELEGRRIVTYRGMAPYYYFLPEGVLTFRSDARGYVWPAERYWPGADSASLERSRYHTPVDYRVRYGPATRAGAPPALFIQNKFTVEWGSGPVNFLPLDLLERLFRLSERGVRVIYSRPDASLDPEQFTRDSQTACDYPDFALAARYPGVEVLEHTGTDGSSYNELKLRRLASIWTYVSVQGGGTHLLSTFSDARIVVLHRFGHEYPDVYARGRYTLLAEPPPRFHIARTWPELNEWVGRIEAARWVDGQPLLEEVGLA